MGERRASSAAADAAADPVLDGATATRDTRTAILETSLALFTVDGFRGTSVRDISGLVGVTQPTLYYHFGSKDGILAALIEPLVEAGEALLDRLIELEAGRDRDLDGADFVDAALGGYYDLIVVHLEVFRLVETDAAIRSHPIAGHRLADQASRFLRLVAIGDDHRQRLAAAAAIGAVRNALRLADVDPEIDRSVILGAARAARWSNAVHEGDP